MSRSVRGNLDGGGPWGGRVRHTLTRATRSLACMPCTLRCHLAGVPTLHAQLPQSPGAPPTSTPGEQGALPTSSTVWRTQPSSKQGTSFEFFRRREVRRKRERGGEALAEHGSSRTPASCLCYWARGPGQREGRMDRQTARASNSFCLELDFNVLRVGKWFSIESIIFFLSLNIYLLKLPPEGI